MKKQMVNLFPVRRQCQSEINKFFLFLQIPNYLYCRRETRTECTNEYIDVMEELFEATKDFLGGKDLDLKLSKDLYMKLVQLHACADLAHVGAARATKLNQIQELFRQLNNN